MGIREERKAATRQDIQAATLDLIDEAGLDAVTVAQIAARAGISERTFFRYYDSKEAAAVPGQGELVEALVSKQLAPGLSAAEILAELIGVCRERFVHEVAHHEFVRISQLMLREPKMLQMVGRRELELVTVLSASLAERGLLSRMRALLVAELIACIWRVSWQCFAQQAAQQPEEGGGTDPVELFEQTVADLAEITSPAGAGPGSGSGAAGIPR